MAISDQFAELQTKLKSLRDSGMGKESQQLVRDSGEVVYDAAVSSAAGVGLPERAMEDMFISSKASQDRRQTVLVGLRKRGRSAPYAHGYVEWYAGKQRGSFAKTQRSRRGRSKPMVTGRKIGESLGTMWELGTTKMAPRPWFRTAVQGVQDAVVAKFTEGYRSIVERAAGE
jgi:hypothetical protein